MVETTTVLFRITSKVNSKISIKKFISNYFESLKFYYISISIDKSILINKDILLTEVTVHMPDYSGIDVFKSIIDLSNKFHSMGLHNHVKLTSNF